MSDNQPTKQRISFGPQRPISGNPAGEAAKVKLVEFPNTRSYKWTPLAAQGTDPPDIALVVSQEVLEAVNRLVAASLDYEIGGFLLGNRYQCPTSHRDYVIIDQYLAAQFTEATSVSLMFTKDAWARLDEDLTGKFLGKLLVGWYHSHPRMDIFLSSHDLAIHEQRFPEIWKSALVIEPQKDLGGYFSRRKGRLDSRTPVEFYEYLEVDAVQSPNSVMPWNGYICHHPVNNQELNPSRPLRQSIVVSSDRRLVARNREQSTDPEVRVQPFPVERTHRWVPATVGAVVEPAMSLLVAQEILQSTNRAALASPNSEIGGFLLGNRYRCPNSNRTYVIIDQSSPAQFSEKAGPSLMFTDEARKKLAKELSGKFSGKELVGWYRFHFNTGISLSERETALHNDRFSEEWKTALIIDPRQRLGGFFSRHDGRFDATYPVAFHEYYDDLQGSSQTPATPPWNGYVQKEPLANEVVDLLSPRADLPAPPSVSNGVPAKESQAKPQAPNKPSKWSALVIGAFCTIALAAITFITWRIVLPPIPAKASVAVIERPKVLQSDGHINGLLIRLRIGPLQDLGQTVIKIDGKMMQFQNPTRSEDMWMVDVKDTNPELVGYLHQLKEHSSGQKNLNIEVDMRNAGSSDDLTPYLLSADSLFFEDDDKLPPTDTPALAHNTRPHDDPESKKKPGEVIAENTFTQIQPRSQNIIDTKAVPVSNEPDAAGPPIVGGSRLPTLNAPPKGVGLAKLKITNSSVYLADPKNLSQGLLIDLQIDPPIYRIEDVVVKVDGRIAKIKQNITNDNSSPLVQTLVATFGGADASTTMDDIKAVREHKKSKELTIEIQDKQRSAVTHVDVETTLFFKKAEQSGSANPFKRVKEAFTGNPVVDLAKKANATAGQIRTCIHISDQYADCAKQNNMERVLSIQQELAKQKLSPDQVLTDAIKNVQTQPNWDHLDKLANALQGLADRLETKGN